jgi:hypothetical protein
MDCKHFILLAAALYFGCGIALA